MEVEKASSSQSNERGATMVEYVLLASLLAIVAIAGVTKVGQETHKTFDIVAAAVTGFTP